MNEEVPRSPVSNERSEGHPLVPGLEQELDVTTEVHELQITAGAEFSIRSLSVIFRLGAINATTTLNRLRNNQSGTTIKDADTSDNS